MESSSSGYRHGSLEPSALSLTFRDVTILHADDAAGWNTYLLEQFRPNELGMKIETINMSMYDNRNPPEITVAIQESYVVLLFVTDGLLGYMETHKSWLPTMLKQRDSNLTCVFSMCLCVDTSDLDDVGERLDYDCQSWEITELLEDCSNIPELVKKVYHHRDSNQSRHKRQTKLKNRRALTLPSVEINPSKYSAVNERTVILFPEEVTRDTEICLEYSNYYGRTVATWLNPYTAWFIPPSDLTEENMIIDVLLNESYKFLIEWQAVSSSFTSLEFLQQTCDVSSVDALDHLLATRFQHRLPGQPAARHDMLEQPGTQTNANICNPFPTLLHWSAAHGLRELVSVMVEAPGASVACSLKNNEDNTPADLARHAGHTELADYMIQFQDARECAELAGNVTKFQHDKTMKVKSGRPEPASQDPPPPHTPQGRTRGPPVAPQPRQSSPDYLLVGEGNEEEDAVYHDPEQDDYLYPDECLLPQGSGGSRGQAELIAIQKKPRRFSEPTMVNINEEEDDPYSFVTVIPRSRRTIHDVQGAGLAKLREDNQSSLESLHITHEEKDKKSDAVPLSPFSVVSKLPTNLHGSHDPTQLPYRPRTGRIDSSRSFRVTSNTKKLADVSMANGQTVKRTMSMDSGRASNTSNLSLDNEDDIPQQDAPMMRRKSVKMSSVGVTVMTNQFGKSARDSFMQLPQKEDKPPPLPPRKTKATPPSVSQKPKPSVFRKPKQADKTQTLPRQF